MMQKQNQIFILIVLMFLFSSEFVRAGIISLPRYTGEFAYRTNSGGRDKTCAPSYQYSCTGTGYSGGSGASCQDKYQSCTCTADYKWSGGACVLKTCSDYGYQANEDTTKSCESKTPRSGLTCYTCSSCDVNTYKYGCSGGLNAGDQGTNNKCGNYYSECICVENAVWNSSGNKCECKSDYKASGSSCVLKTCEDYGYEGSEDKTKDCSKQTPRSGLECWNCSECTGSYYDCGALSNTNGGEGTACGGKYPRCKCKSNYFWDNGKCVLSCTPKACTATDSCEGQTCEVFRSSAISTAADLGSGIGSYTSCTPTNCDNSGHQYGYLPTACADGYSGYDIGSCAKPMSMDCAELGFTSGSCSSGQSAIKCPFGNKYVCFDKATSGGGATDPSCPAGETKIHNTCVPCMNDSEAISKGYIYSDFTWGNELNDAKEKCKSEPNSPTYSNWAYSCGSDGIGWEDTLLVLCL